MTYLDSERKSKLHELGHLIREHGNKSYKKHGNYWTLVLDKVQFYHDDYNRSVWLQDLDANTIVYFGIDWGGFESKATDMEFDMACMLLESYHAVMNLKPSDES